MGVLPKLDPEALRAYWDSLHDKQLRGQIAPLAAVCSSSAPALLNRLVQFEQKEALEQVWRHAGNLTGKLILDLGCGTGRWIDALRQRGARVVGIDWSYGAVVGVWRRQQAPTAQMSVASLGFAEQVFDGVTCVTVLQHAPPETQQRAFEEVFRVLKPGGFFCLLEASFQDTPAPHMFPRPLSDWLGLARGVGYEVVRAAGCQYETLLPLYNRLRHRVRKAIISDPPTVSVSNLSPREKYSWLAWLDRMLVTLLALLSFPVGRALAGLRLLRPSHSLIVLERPSAGLTPNPS